MKRFKIGFLAIIAIAAMSFTIATQSNFIKKPPVTINNCYKSVAGQFLQTCSFPVNWGTLNCSNKTNALGQVIRSGINYGLYTTTEIECDNADDIICCIQFESAGTTDPCGNTTEEFKADGTIKDNTNTIITTNDYIKVKAFECKD